MSRLRTLLADPCVWGPLLIAVVGWIAYRPSLHGVFILDDHNNITRSKLVRDPVPSLELLKSPRWFAYWTFSINYYFGQDRPFGYHVVNVIIHLLAGVFLFGLTRRVLLLTPRYQAQAGWLALAAALLWVVHPLQTQSVTYVVQRMESLMGLFYVMVFYALVLGSEASGRVSEILWYVAAMICCMLGMATKEVMATAPLLALIFDRIYLSPSWRAVFARRGWVYAVLFFSALPLALATSRGAFEPGSAGFKVAGVTPWDYAKSQPSVILHYLGLTIWPDRLCLDYLWPIVNNPNQILITAILILAMLVVTARLLFRAPRLGFLFLAFFVILAPSSSFVPIRDLAFEHRMYLPLAPLCILAVLGLRQLLDFAIDVGNLRPEAAAWFGGLAVAVVVFALGWRTYERNIQYQDLMAMWEDVLLQNRNNGRAYLNYAEAIEQKADAEFDPAKRRALVDKALRNYRKGVELSEYNHAAHNSLATLLQKHGRDAEAIEQFQKAISLNPNFAHARNGLGVSLTRLGQLDEARDEFLKAVELAPDNAVILTNVGMSYGKEGFYADAAKYLRRAVEIDPKNTEAVDQLGVSLTRLDRWDEALPLFQKAVTLRPDDPKYRMDLAGAFDHLGDKGSGRAEWIMAVRLLASHPDDRKRNPAEGLTILKNRFKDDEERDAQVEDLFAMALAGQGQLKEAIEHAEFALAKTNDPAHRRMIEERIKLYKDNKFFVDPSLVGP